MSAPSNEHPFNNDWPMLTKKIKARQTKPETILSEPDLNPFERLVSEQGIVEATPECKLVDNDEKDEMNIVL